MTQKPILIFEYFTANGINNQSIVLEAISMIKSLVDDLKHKNINLIISNKYKNYFTEDINITFINKPIQEWLKTNSKKYDKAIFIADETENHLYNITKILEENNVKLYCSTSDSVKICSNKFQTYTLLKGIVKQPQTFKIKITDNWKNEIHEIFNKLNCKLIIKPINGVDCEEIQLIIEKNDINNLKNYKFGTEILIQEFIEGKSCSVSLISDGKTTIPLSLNKQNIIINKNNNTYNGGMLPYNHKLEKKAFKLATKAVNSINGLKGFVGVDLIIDDDVTFIEINSRFTTPYIGLKKIININIGDTIFKILDDELKLDELKKLKLNGKIEFIKENNDIKLISI